MPPRLLPRRSRHRCRTGGAGFLLAAVLLFPPARLAGQEEWSTLRGSNQRHGFYSEVPAPPFRLAWRKELYRELTGPRAEIIVAEGLAFLGTYAGRLYAWDARDGSERWMLRTEGPIGHSPAASQGLLFFGSMDRFFRAVDLSTGAERWKVETEAGIWPAPLAAAGRVFFGDRAGWFYALESGTGRSLWRFRTGAMILSSPALSSDGKRVFIASEDMYLYCLEASSGELRWRSRQLSGSSLRDYAPVVFAGLVMISSNPIREFHQTLTEHQEMLVRRSGFQGDDPRYIPERPGDLEVEQDFIVDFLTEHPEEQTFFAFDEVTGKEPWIAPILYSGGMHNPMTPVCVNPQTGEIFTQVRSAYGTWDGGGEVRPFTGFGRLDPRTGRVALLSHSYASRDPDRPAGAQDAPWMTFNYIGDETQSLSCAPGFLFCTHQGYLGQLDLATGRTENLFGKRDTYGGFYGPGNFGWENDGGEERARSAGEPYGIINEWHGPARAIVSAAGGRLYYHTGAQVLCLEPAKSND